MNKQSLINLKKCFINNYNYVVAKINIIIMYNSIVFMQVLYIVNEVPHC